MARAKTSIVLSEQHKTWLQSQGSISEVLSQLIEQEQGRLATEAREREAQLAKLSRKDRFLFWVAEKFYVPIAQKQVGASDSEIEKWRSEDPAFLDRVVARQSEFLNGLELLIVEAARGLRHIDKAAMSGLIALLNNLSPNWGRVKAELLGRICGPVFDRLLKIVKSKVPPPTYKEIAEEFASYKEIAFSEFSE